MTTETASGAIGMAAAIGAAMMQSSASAGTSLLVPVISGVVGFAASYGILKASVAALGREIQVLRHDSRNFQQAQQSLLTEALERIARIEGRLEDRRSVSRD
jgi:hypothetical protein